MLQLNSTLAEVRNLLEELNSIFELRVERITGVKDKSIKIILSEEEKEDREREMNGASETLRSRQTVPSYAEQKS